MFVWEQIARILGSFDKQTARAQTAGDQATRQGISKHSWPSIIRARLLRSSSAISKSDRFPVVLPLLDCNSVISKPHYSKSFSPWFSRGTFCRIGWSYRARCKEKGKCMPRNSGTSSLATGQSCPLRYSKRRLARSMSWFPRGEQMFGTTNAQSYLCRRRSVPCFQLWIRHSLELSVHRHDRRQTFWWAGWLLVSWRQLEFVSPSLRYVALLAARIKN